MLSFAAAYAIRVHIDPRPIPFESQLLKYVSTVAWVIPILLIILAVIGLYKKSIFLGKSRIGEIGRLAIAAVLSVAALIVYGFFVEENFFPVRIVALTSVVLSFVFLSVERIIIRFIVRMIFRSDYGAKRAVIIGNHKNTDYLADYIASTPEAGYKLVGSSKKSAGGRDLPNRREVDRICL